MNIQTFLMAGFTTKNKQTEEIKQEKKKKQTKKYFVSIERRGSIMH